MSNPSAPLNEGDLAPDFTLPTNGGGTFELKSLKGSPVIVYFYPKDNTPGCTTEAIDFSSHQDAFKSLGATVIGISPDSVRKHDNFVAKHELSILLGADEDRTAIEAYGVWVEKKMYGKSYMGVDRSTFLVDDQGKLAKIWRKVKVKGHAEEVLAELQSLKTED